MKNFLIAGGGTSGWMTAAILDSIYPDSKITLLDSKKINTIGVGESTTPAILDFLNITNINFADFVKKTESTIKIGINFENWTKVDSSYLHTFELLKDKSLGGVYWGIDYLQDFANRKHTYEYMSRRNLVPVTKEGIFTGTHALHIDALKLAEYLKEFLKHRVIVKDALITKVHQDDISVTSVELDTGELEVANIYFDCTGFKRVIHTEVGSKWKSLKDLLPVDSAIPCPIDWSTPMNTTHASALNSGWVWQVPLQSRIGSGYVFSSAHCKDPESEFVSFIKKKYKKDITPDKIINFESGYVANPWNKNVVCIGLSSGFVEPLESTSIHMIIHQVLAFTQNYDGKCSKVTAELYNRYMCDMFEDAAAFIKLHYMSTPYNNDFWHYMNDDKPKSLRLEHLLEIWKEHIPSADHIGQNKNQTVGYRIFAIAAWLQVLTGMNKLNRVALSRYIDFNRMPVMEKDFSNLITQREFLEKLLGL